MGFQYLDHCLLRTYSLPHRVFAAAVRQREPWKQHSGNSLKEKFKEDPTTVEQLKIQLQQEKEAQVQHFQQELQQEQEKEIQLFRQQTEGALW